jgi:hypothetical protein
LFRGERRDEGAGGLQNGRQRYAGLFEREKSRHDLATAGDSPEGLSQTRMGPSSMGFSRGGKLNGRAAGVGGRFRKPKCAYSPAILCSS